MPLNSTTWTELAYLGVLALVIGGYFVVSHRGRMGQVARQGALWVLIFAGAIAVAGLWTDIRNAVTPRQSVAQDGGAITLPRAMDGHYYVTLNVNGTPTRFIVDTGATDMVLSRGAAAAAGVDLNRLIFSGEAFTANGRVRTATVFLDSVKVGELEAQGVRAVINEGPMPESLLGMSFLEIFSRIEIEDDRMVLTL